LAGFIVCDMEQSFSVAVIITLTVLFRKECNSQGRLVKAMSANAYTVYVFHVPIIVFLAISLQGIVLDPLFKFILVSPLAVSLCFILSNYIRQLPIARSIL